MNDNAFVVGSVGSTISRQNPHLAPCGSTKLLRDLIRLAGLPENSIEIVFTGIGQCEKLYEELYYGEVSPSETTHDQIRIAHCRDFGTDAVKRNIERLTDVAFGNTDKIREFVTEIVPEYVLPGDSSPQPAGMG